MKIATLAWPGRSRAHALPPPRRDPTIAVLAQRLAWAWAAAAALMLFVGWWLQARGTWVQLVQGDPSGISVAIVVLSLVVTGWCGHRAWRLQQQAQAGSAWRLAHRRDRERAPELALHLLSERSHGAHETAWWFAAACIKLGLLGTVLGFIVMASRIGELPTFDFDQVQVLLQRMTAGMAIALYTTLVGLLANLWLGLQLLLLDRMADRIAADILADVPEGGDGDAA